MSIRRRIRAVSSTAFRCSRTILVRLADRLGDDAAHVERETVVLHLDVEDFVHDRDRFVRCEVAAAEEIEVARRTVCVQPDGEHGGALENQAVAMGRDGKTGEKSLPSVHGSDVVERLPTAPGFVQEPLAHGSADVDHRRFHPASTSRYGRMTATARQRRA
jgi:hypothetical protein